jgi:hypothetical protein
MGFSEIRSHVLRRDQFGAWQARCVWGRGMRSWIVWWRRVEIMPEEVRGEPGHFWPGECCTVPAAASPPPKTQLSSSVPSRLASPSPLPRPKPCPYCLSPKPKRPTLAPTATHPSFSLHGAAMLRQVLVLALFVKWLLLPISKIQKNSEWAGTAA